VNHEKSSSSLVKRSFPEERDGVSKSNEKESKKVKKKNCHNITEESVKSELQKLWRRPKHLKVS
jgi:hypothetical protein